MLLKLEISQYDYANLFNVNKDCNNPGQPWKNKHNQLQWKWHASLIWVNNLNKKLYVHFELCMWIKFNDPCSRAQNLRDDTRLKVRCASLTGNWPLLCHQYYLCVKTHQYKFCHCFELSSSCFNQYLLSILSPRHMNCIQFWRIMISDVFLLSKSFIQVSYFLKPL